MPVLKAESDGTVIEVRDGLFEVKDVKSYLLEVEHPLEAERLPPFITPLPIGSGRIARVCFDNYVGLAEASGLRFRVNHSKLSGEAFDGMLDAVVAGVMDLAFDFAAPTALPFERDVLSNE